MMEVDNPLEPCKICGGDLCKDMYSEEMTCLSCRKKDIYIHNFWQKPKEKDEGKSERI